ncbi:hypothetical protein BsWGS_18572 [Bradybaena similaris]
MNSFTMAVHTVLEAMSALLHAGDTTLYLLLTCVSVLFSVLFIFRRRKEKDGESSLRWMPASGISLDPIIASQSPTTSLIASFKQGQNTETTQDHNTETTQDHNTETTQDHNTETTQDHNTETTQDHNTETTQDHNTETTQGQNTETTQDQNTETTHDQNTETLHDQNTETTQDHNTETTQDHNTETTQDHNTETTQDQNTETTRDQKTETAREQNTETTQDHNTETTQDQNTETTRDQKTETAREQNTETTQDQNTETLHDQNTETTQDQNTETTQEQNAETTQDQNTETTQEQNTETTHDQNTETTQEQSTETTQDGAIIHRKHRHQCQHPEFFLSSRFIENTFDSSINGELQCNNGLEPSHWRNETDIHQHKLRSDSCELLYQGIIDSAHSDALTQCSITGDSHTDELSAGDTSHSGELFQPAIRDSSYKNELSRGDITDLSHKDELTQGGITDSSHNEELLQRHVANTSHKDELSRGGITDFSHKHELFQHLVADTSQKNELSKGGITNTFQQGEPFQHPVANTSHKDELSQRGTTDSSRNDDLIQHPFSDTCKNDELSQGGITDSSHVDELLQHSITDSSHRDQLLQSSSTDSSHTNELLQRPITNSSHTDELLQSSIIDSSHTNELLQHLITNCSHDDELLQRPITNSCHDDELLQCPITNHSHTDKLLQGPITDVRHADKLLQCPITDSSHTDELLQQITPESYTDEMCQCPIQDTSDSDELSQPAIADPYCSLHQCNIHKSSRSKHAQAGSITTSDTLWDSGRDINNIHCRIDGSPKRDKMDHQRETIHVLTDRNKHNKYHKEIRLHNKEKACKGEPESVDTMLTCNLDTVQHKHFWRQLSLDSRHLRRLHDTIRYSSASNVAHNCDKHTRELRIRQHDSLRQSQDATGTVSSCQNKSVSEDIIVQTPSVIDPPNMIHNSSNIYCSDEIPDSKGTSMSKRADIKTDPDFNQVICFQQEKANSEFLGDTCQTLRHSLPLRSKYRGVRYNSERCPSPSRRNMSAIVCQRLDETTPQHSGHTTLEKSCSQESVPIQSSCAREYNIATDHVIPLHRDRINSSANQTSASADILYGNPEQRHTNWRFQSLQVKGRDFPDSSRSVKSPDSVPEICSNHQHPQSLPESAVYRHELGQIQSASENTSTSTTAQQIQLRRKRWGKSFFTPTERSQSAQLDFMSRPLSLPVPVISQSNDSLTRRKLVTLADMQEHLSRHTKGIFRKRVSVNNMLTWSKDPIQKPMIRTKDKSIRREACEIFKNILFSKCRMNERTNFIIIFIFIYYHTVGN